MCDILGGDADKTSSTPSRSSPGKRPGRVSRTKPNDPRRSKPPKPDKRSKPPRTVRRDMVDEKCARLGIRYYKWKGIKLSKLHKSHVSAKKNLDKYIPRGQKVNEDCILCPQQIQPQCHSELLIHVQRVHVKRKVIVGGLSLLMCRCSDVRSQGCDNSARNKHYHCPECHQPCYNPAKLKCHLLSKHSHKYQSGELKHLNRTKGGDS